MATGKVKFGDSNGIIYNNRNVLIQKKDVRRILKKAGITGEKVRDLEIWQEAFTHETYALNEHNKKRNEQFHYHMENAGKHFDRDEEGNLVEVVDSDSDGDESVHSDLDFDEIVEVQERSYEKLEWFGNRFLQTVSALYLKNRYPDVDEGFLTKTQIKLVKPDVIAELALKCGMDKFVLVSRYQELKRNGRLNPKFLRCVFTSFLACIFFDLGGDDYGRGMMLVYRFFESLFDKYGGLAELAKVDTNYKHKLMEYFQQHFEKGILPKYVGVEEKIVDKNRWFVEGIVSSADEGFVLGKGEGITKTEAQQAAAKEALRKYGVSEEEMNKVLDKKIHRTYTFGNLANRNNKRLKSRDIEDVLRRYGVEIGEEIYVNDLDIWQEAFVHKSYVKQPDIHKDYEVRGGLMDLQPRSYESLEYYGDRILQTVSAIYLWKRYPHENEDFFTKTQSKLVRKEHFAKLSGSLGLNRYLVISRYLENEKYGRVDKNNLEDIFEAFFGAFYQDIGKNNLKTGINVIMGFFTELLEDQVDMGEIISVNENYKHMLMEFFHKEFNGGLPEYRNGGFVEQGKKKVFTQAVHDVDGKFIASGRSTTKQKAEQFAAKHALIHYGFIKKGDSNPFSGKKDGHIKYLGLSMDDMKERIGCVPCAGVAKETKGAKAAKKVKLVVKKKTSEAKTAETAEPVAKKMKIKTKTKKPKTVKLVIKSGSGSESGGSTKSSIKEATA